jgi:hypothetical protein
MNHLFPEIISEIVQYLDYNDQRNVFSTCRAFYRARPYLVFMAIENESQLLKSQQGANEIPRDEIISHNAFLRLINGLYTTTQPTEKALESLVALYAQEIISAWMVPVNEHGAEIRFNDSLEDTNLYHQRYPLLQRLGMILRWNGAGRPIAEIVKQWLISRWEEIKDEEEVVLFTDPDYNAPPVNIDLQPHQEKILRGLEFLSNFPIIYYAPQCAAGEAVSSRLNDESWRHPGFDRLKLWLSIPELWNMDVRHLEIRQVIGPPYQVYQQIVKRSLLHVILFRCSEFVGFALRVMSFLRTIEISTPSAELIRGTRYWYEEGFCGAALYWDFHLHNFPGQYISLFKKPLVDIIRGYLYLYGPWTISDLILNMVHHVRQRRRTRAQQILVARTVMSELLRYGYDFLSREAEDALVGLMEDERGVRRDASGPKGEESSVPGVP